jgi:hypothetical protein
MLDPETVALRWLLLMLIERNGKAAARDFADDARFYARIFRERGDRLVAGQIDALADRIDRRALPCDLSAYTLH